MGFFFRLCSRSVLIEGVIFRTGFFQQLQRRKSAADAGGRLHLAGQASAQGGRQGELPRQAEARAPVEQLPAGHPCRAAFSP
jgi:hypothetical protein